VPVFVCPDEIQRKQAEAQARVIEFRAKMGSRAPASSRLLVDLSNLSDFLTLTPEAKELERRRLVHVDRMIEQRNAKIEEAKTREANLIKADSRVRQLVAQIDETCLQQQGPGNLCFFKKKKKASQ
jgi:hypothetical protein